MKEGLLSIVIISYENSSLVVKRAIQSIREQKYRDYEIILIDANDEESVYSRGLREDMEKYPDIVLVSCPSRLGNFALAKNKGAEAANGEYISFLMANDAWNSEYIQKQIEILKEEREIGLVFCHAWRQEEDAFSIEYRTPPLSDHNGEGYIEKEFLFQESIPTVSQVMLRSSIFYEMHGFDLNMKGQDSYDLWLRVLAKYRVVEIEENLVCCYIEKDFLKKSHKLSDATGCLQLYSKHKKMYDSNLPGKLELFEKTAECYKNSHDYLRWAQYTLKVKSLEKKGRTNKENERAPMV